MKRYIIFAMEEWYPLGGFYDYYDTSDNLEEAIKIAEKALEEKFKESHVLDTKDWKIVYE